MDQGRKIQQGRLSATEIQARSIQIMCKEWQQLHLGKMNQMDIVLRLLSLEDRRTLNHTPPCLQHQHSRTPLGMLPQLQIQQGSGSLKSTENRSIRRGSNPGYTSRDTRQRRRFQSRCKQHALVGWCRHCTRCWRRRCRQMKHIGQVYRLRSWNRWLRLRDSTDQQDRGSWSMDQGRKIQLGRLSLMGIQAHSSWEIHMVLLWMRWGRMNRGDTVLKPSSLMGSWLPGLVEGAVQ